MLENLKPKKTAIILFNLGGPDSLKSVKPFLFNLFYDPTIIRLSNPWRWIVAKLISTLRNKKAQHIYSLIGGKSSLLAETERQREALLARLKSTINTDFEIFTCMRHWHPKASSVIKEVEKYEPTEIVTLPLYPQFSTTTTGSSMLEFNKLVADSKTLSLISLKSICCYYNDKSFIKSHTSIIIELLKKLKNQNNYRILFSAHSLPKKVIEHGDPYQWQIEETVENIVNDLNIEYLDYKITYQSRATPIEWLKPCTEEEIKATCIEGKDLVIVPIAFVSEHVETLVELDIEYKAIADKYKIQYIRSPTLGIDDIFIDSLSKMIINFSENNQNKICNSSLKKTCSEKFTDCPCNI